MEDNEMNRRWYVAWHPDEPYGVVRSKDAAGLEEWRRRQWNIFPSPPHILDVTTAVGELLAQFSPDVRSACRHAFAVVLTLDGDVPSLRFRPNDGPPLSGEVADVTESVREVFIDILGASKCLNTWLRRPSVGFNRVQRVANRFVVFPNGAPERGFRLPVWGEAVDGLLAYDGRSVVMRGERCPRALRDNEAPPLREPEDGWLVVQVVPEVEPGQELAANWDGFGVPPRASNVVVAIAREVRRYGPGLCFASFDWAD